MAPTKEMLKLVAVIETVKVKGVVSLPIGQFEDRTCINRPYELPKFRMS